MRYTQGEREARIEMMILPCYISVVGCMHAMDGILGGWEALAWQVTRFTIRKK